MQNIVADLEPKLLWKHFAALAAIPRGSKNEKQVAQHVLAEAARLGLDCQQDKTGNVIIRKKAHPGKEKAPIVILQGHLDMVCEKNENTVHDFLKDPIHLVRDGDFIKADGTTLGADNGIGVAAALAVMESTDIVHGPLEFLFTVDEETGLTGAFNLEPGFIKSKLLLNLDGEDENELYIGCAGGVDTVAIRKIAKTKAGSGKKPYRLKIADLKGGHSGLNIHEGRGNALKILGRVLRKCRGEFGLEISAVEGGSKRNAIPREAFATFFMDPAQESAFREELQKMEQDCRSELGPADPELSISLASCPNAYEKVFKEDDAKTVIDFIYAGPHGVVSMNPDIPGLVQTSTNFAIVENKGDRLVVQMSHRSSVESAKQDVADMVAAYCTLGGFEVEQGHGYPGWKPDLNSQLLKIARKVYCRVFNREPAVKAIHAGLECGIIGERFPGMDMIAFGPTVIGAHSPVERVSISAVAVFWKYLQAMLAELCG